MCPQTPCSHCHIPATVYAQRIASIVHLFFVLIMYCCWPSEPSDLEHACGTPLYIEVPVPSNRELFFSYASICERRATLYVEMNSDTLENKGEFVSTWRLPHFPGLVTESGFNSAYPMLGSFVTATSVGTRQIPT